MNMLALLLTASLMGIPGEASDTTPTLPDLPDPMLIATGAQVYNANCSRCHNARAPAERTDMQWRIIMQHMRVRANLSRSHTEAVTAYLQTVNAPVVVASEARPAPVIARTERADRERDKRPPPPR